MRNKNIKAYKKKNGTKAYKFKAYLGTDPVTGKRVETTRRGFKSAREAQRALDRLRVDYDNNGWHKRNDGQIRTFGELFSAWHKVHSQTIKVSTAGQQKKLYEADLKNDFDNIKLDKLTPQYIQNFFNDFAKTHSTIKNCAVLLKMPLQYAVKMEIIDSSPFDKVVLPKGQKSQFEGTVNFYTREELTYFLKCAKKVDQKLYTYFWLLAYTGARKSEALALIWDDINFDKKALRIDKTLAYNPINRDLLVQDTKTKSSVRTISLDQQTIQVLKQWHLNLQKRNFKLGLGNTNIIFPNKFNQYTTTSVPQQWLERIYGHFPQKQIRVHGFRHTHASLLFEAGASIKEVQVRLGHGNASTTMDVYAHVLKSRSNETGERFAKYMNN